MFTYFNSGITIPTASPFWEQNFVTASQVTNLALYASDALRGEALLKIRPKKRNKD